MYIFLIKGDKTELKIKIVRVVLLLVHARLKVRAILLKLIRKRMVRTRVIKAIKSRVGSAYLDAWPTAYPLNPSFSLSFASASASALQFLSLSLSLSLSQFILGLIQLGK